MKYILAITLSLMSILFFASLEIELTIRKKKNSLIENVTDVADSAYTTYASIKGVIR